MRARHLLPFVLAVLGLAGCGGGDDDAGVNPASEPSEPAGAGSFEASDVPFTFSYPDGFEQVDEDDMEVLAVVTNTPGNQNNGIKIREAAERELPFNSYAGSLKAQFEQDLGTEVEQREEEHAGISMGILEWRSSYEDEERGEKRTLELHSTSYFLAGAGRTWHIECLSSQDERRAIAAACEQALETIRFPDG